jgi:hypothetical protein
VVLAQRHDLDVAYQNELLVPRLERRGEHLTGVDAQPGEQLRVRTRHPGRGTPEPFAIRVLSDREQDLADGALDAGQVDRALDRSAVDLTVDQPSRKVVQARLFVVGLGGRGVAGRPDQR